MAMETNYFELALLKFVSRVSWIAQDGLELLTFLPTQVDLL